MESGPTFFVAFVQVVVLTFYKLILYSILAMPESDFQTFLH